MTLIQPLSCLSKQDKSIVFDVNMCQPKSKDQIKLTLILSLYIHWYLSKLINIFD